MWKQWLNEYPGRIAGAAAGFLLGVVYLIVGFWDMLVFAFLIAVGDMLGKRMDKDEGPLLPWSKVLNWVDRLLSRQRPFR